MSALCTVVRNISYFEAGPELKKCCRLDVYLPSEHSLEPGQKCPVVIHVHGGGWQRGSKQMRGSPVFGRACAAEGMVAVLMDYRLADGTLWFAICRALPYALLAGLAVLLLSFVIRPLKWWIAGIVFAAVFAFKLYPALKKRKRNRAKLVSHPEQVQDVARSIAWVYNNLTQMCPHADLDKVFISGHSAGAHLATLVALDHAYLQAEAVPRDFIKGVIAISGIYTVNAPFKSKVRNFVFRWLYTRTAFGRDGSVWRQASSINHVSASAPPFVILSASKDHGLEFDAARLYQRLQDHNVPCSYHTVPSTTHHSILARLPHHAAKTHVMGFLRSSCQRLVGNAPRAAMPAFPQPSAPAAHKVVEFKSPEKELLLSPGGFGHQMDSE